MTSNVKRKPTIGETVAAIGLILSLVFVAFEIRQNTAAVRAQTRQQLTDASAEMLLAFATTDLGDLWVGYSDGEKLTESEINKVRPALVAAVRNLENVYLQYREGVIDESALSSYGWKGSVMYSSSSFAEWWITNRDRFHPDFVQAFAALHGLEG